MENETKSNLSINFPLAFGSLAMLGLVYLFQRINYLEFIARLVGNHAQPVAAFVFNRTLRLILNDLACMALIYALFRNRKYVRLAFIVFCIELFLILPAYLLIKLSVEGTSEISSPLLSPIHRLIVNPMLMGLLIISFYYQKLKARESQ
jgi:exosortase F-associated protein